MNLQQFKEKFQKSSIDHYSNRVFSTVLVSVIVQTFNQEKFIKKCLDSILSQKTEFDFEILIGEDNSSDKTREICIAYANRFPQKIRLFLHRDENKIKVDNIPTGNFNAFYNFYNARGKYIAFCEGDDYWNDPLKLEKQVDFLEANKTYISSYHLFQVKENDKTLLKDNFFLSQPTSDISAQELQTLKFHPHISTICFRKTFADLPEQIIKVINIDSFIISMLGNYGKMKFIEDIKPSIYRRHLGGVWSNRIKKLKYESKIILYTNLEDYYRSFNNKGLADLFRIRRKNIYKMQLFLYLKNGEIFKSPKTTIRLFLQTFQEFHIRTNRK